MKQEPILPSIHVSAMTAPPQRMIPSLVTINSDRLMGESGIIALLLHGFCALIAFWCMDIPKQDNPLHSSIEITYEAPVALPIPEEASVLSNDMDSDLHSSLTEPSVPASDALPETDPIASIPVPKPQKFVQERKIVTTQSSETIAHTDSVSHSSSMNTQKVKTQSTTATTSPAKKVLSVVQRCSAVSKEYPMAAKKRHEEGTAQVSFQLFPDGQVKQVEVVESTGYSDLDRVAMQAVKNMKCQAALEQPVVKFSIPVKFSLNKVN